MDAETLWNNLSENVKVDFLFRFTGINPDHAPNILCMNAGFPTFLSLSIKQTLPKKIYTHDILKKWIMDYSIKGGDAYVMMYIESTNNLYLWQGIHLTRLEQEGTESVPPALRVILNKKGWQEVFEYFTGE